MCVGFKVVGFFEYSSHTSQHSAAGFCRAESTSLPSGKVYFFAPMTKTILFSVSEVQGL